MQPVERAAKLAMDLESLHNLRQNILKIAGFVTVYLSRVAVHRVTYPYNTLAGLTHAIHKRRERGANARRPKSRYQDDLARLIVRVEPRN